MFSLPRKNTNLENIQCFKNHGSTEHSTGKHLISSSVDAVKFIYDWKLKVNMVPGRVGGAKISSPEFPNRTNSEVTWYLTILPLSLTFDGKNMIFDLQLTLASCNVKELKADYKFRVFDEHGNAALSNYSETHTNVFMQNEPGNASEYYSLGGPYSSGIHVYCEIIVSSSQFQPTQSIPKKLTDPNFTFAEELECIFENENFSDITFSANGKELKLHKVILAARSPVFKAMFEHEMMEKTHNRVEITDIEFYVLRELMSYIYTGNVTNLEQNPKELLVAADKYAIEKLKATCEIVLCERVSTESVVEMFIFADTLNLVELKDKAKNFIVSNAKDVSETTQWKSMILTHPQLLAEAFLAIAIK